MRAIPIFVFVVFLNSEKNPKEFRLNSKRISKGRLGNSKDLIDLVRFLEDHDYTNSGVIELNGGLDFY